jgi:allantoinase
MHDHSRFDYSPIVDRKPWRLPNGARVALWVIPNIEHFLFDRPSTSVSSATAHLVPDVLNYSWRDYGLRAGIWRLMDVMEKHGVKGTVALNSDVCARYPQVIEAGRKLDWEWMGHGENNSSLLTDLGEDEERAIIGRVVSTIEKACGARPRGWLGPALSETYNTPDLLAEAGVEYVADWVNDEQPYPMKVRKGTLYSMPYSIEVNDIPAFLEHHLTGEEFSQLICDQFDGLYESGAQSARVMAICLHPFLIGHPHRAKYLDKALTYIRQRQDVWITRGGDILDWYKKSQAG